MTIAESIADWFVAKLKCYSASFPHSFIVFIIEQGIHVGFTLYIYLSVFLNISELFESYLRSWACAEIDSCSLSQWIFWSWPRLVPFSFTESVRISESFGHDWDSYLSFSANQTKSVSQLNGSVIRRHIWSNRKTERICDEIEMNRLTELIQMTQFMVKTHPKVYFGIHFNRSHPEEDSSRPELQIRKKNSSPGAEDLK